jgi:hypothetical protein
MEIKELSQDYINASTGSKTYRITDIIGSIIIDATKTVGKGYTIVHTYIYIHDERRIIKGYLEVEELKRLRDCLNEILKDVDVE